MAVSVLISLSTTTLKFLSAQRNDRLMDFDFLVHKLAESDLTVKSNAVN
jgi:hypothetical protein